MIGILLNNHGFQVKSYYKALRNVGHKQFPRKSLWKVCVPPRIAFFLWLDALGKFLTTNYLRKEEW